MFSVTKKNEKPESAQDCAMGIFFHIFFPSVFYRFSVVVVVVVVVLFVLVVFLPSFSFDLVVFTNNVKRVDLSPFLDFSSDKFI